MDNFNGTIPTLPSDSGKIVQMMGNGSSSAYLFLFSPREMTAQYRRPYDYKFNDKFRGDLSDLITRNMSGVSSLVDDFMLNSADARTSVLPTATAIPLSSAPFNQCWTFLLVVDNDELVTPFGFSKTHPSRIYYMGWCIDEPVTRKNLSQEYVPNPSAIFQTAHHTVLCSRGNFGPDTGYVATDVMSDYDYAPTSVVTQMHHADQTPYDLNPSKVANEIVTSPLGIIENLTNDEYANVSPSISVCANPLMTQATPLQVDTSLNDPTRHLGNIGVLVDNDSQVLQGGSPIYDDNLSFVPYFVPDTTKKLSQSLEEYIIGVDSDGNTLRASDGSTFEDIFRLSLKLGGGNIVSKVRKLKGFRFNIGMPRDRVANAVLERQLLIANRILNSYKR